jgi:lipid A 4'-phosphatase
MNAPARRWPLLPALGLALALLALSALADLPLTRLFYQAGEGFFLDRAWPVQLLYRGTPWLIGGVTAALLAASVWGAVTHSHRVRNAAAYGLLALALGPGLVVNGVLKEYWGRPRPQQLAQFGGTASFVPALWPSRQCAHNCSFVSGHAAAGFFLITGAWIWPRRRRAWLMVGIGAGGLIGLARIVQGGHFLSDVLGALLVVWFTDEAVYRWMERRGWPVGSGSFSYD